MVVIGYFPANSLSLNCLYVADPATFKASNSVLQTLISSENNSFTQFWKKAYISEFVLLPN